MIALILAAGIGSRLKPITDKKPKCMVKVNGRPIIDHTLTAISNAGIQDVVICTGYKAEQIENYCKEKFPQLRITFVPNPEFESTNNMYSLYLAKEHLEQNYFLMNADVVFDEEILIEMMKKESSCIAVDDSIYQEESMKITMSNEFITGISKTITEDNSKGCSIDVYKIVKHDAPRILEEMENIINVAGERNQWTEVMLNNLFQSGLIKAVPCYIGNRRWYEIDNYDDLEAAEKLFNKVFHEINKKTIYILDGDGTLYLGDEPIDGAKEFVVSLKENNKEVYFMSNNSSRRPLAYYEKLKNMNIPIKKENIITSLNVAVQFLLEKDLRRLYWSANADVSGYLQEEGFIYDEDDPQALLLTYDTDFTYLKMLKVIELIREGVPYYATHIDKVCPTPNGPIPDIGLFIHMIRESTGELPIKCFGKPDPSFLKTIVKQAKEKIVLVGDRLYTDIRMADNIDIASILPLTGETTRQDLEESDLWPDIVISSLRELVL